MLHDNFKMTGHLSIAINNEVVQEVPNLVVTDGKEYVASRMKDTTKSAMSHMGVGTGSAAALPSNAALGGQVDRVSLTSTVVSGVTITFLATFPAGTGTGAITEAGLFNQSSAGDMLCRTVFPVVNKSENDSMSISWQVSVS
tara:strand:+ start:7531 stop:7956 length:426 start_codon:yes stop_codon:yes gene_type:complete